MARRKAFEWAHLQAKLTLMPLPGFEPLLGFPNPEIESQPRKSSTVERTLDRRFPYSAILNSRRVIVYDPLVFRHPSISQIKLNKVAVKGVRNRG